MPPAAQVADDTLAWIDATVIGLNLCPFAAPAVRAGRLDIVVSDADSQNALIGDLDHEMRRLLNTSADELETTLIVVTHQLQSFDAFNDFLDIADALLAARNLVGTLQIASFHPDYCFDGVAADDPGNWTNRSPWPMLHLLRERSISAATARHPDAAAIPARNRERLMALSVSEREQLFSGARRGA